MALNFPDETEEREQRLQDLGLKSNQKKSSWGLCPSSS
jgi:hypothetical protein